MLSSERKGRITGSRVGAVLGLNPYCSKNQVLKDMVLEYLGKATQKDSVDMQRGRELEKVAISEYEKLNNLVVQKTPFRIHPTYDFMGATPDGMADNRIIEIKAPRDWYEGIPEYYKAQMELEMECYEVEEATFIQIVGDAMKCLRYEHTSFIKDNLAELEDFMAMYHKSLAESSDFYLEAVSLELKEVREQLKSLKSKEDSLKKEILESVGNKALQTGFLSIVDKKVGGDYDYKAFCIKNNIIPTQDFLKETKIIKEVRV